MRLHAVLIGLAACVASIAWSPQGQTLDYPLKPVRIIIPFPPGGSVDGLARLISARLGERWSQPIVVESRPGAGGNIAYAAAANSAPDGYTWILAANGIATNPSLYANVSFDTLRDFTPITLVASHPAALVTHPNVAATSVQELVALSRTRPGQITFGSAGSGSILHLTGELFKIRTGADFVHVPYKGTAPAITDLLGGQIATIFLDLPLALPHIRSGKMRALGVTSARRSPLLPDLPTIAESVAADFDIVAWFGLLCAARTPKEIVDRINQDVTAALSAPELRTRMSEQGQELIANTSEQFGAFLKAEVANLSRLVKASGARVD